MAETGNYESMSEDELRVLKRAKNAELDALRVRGGPGVRELRAEVLRIQSFIDARQAQRVKGYEERAKKLEAVSSLVEAEAAAAVSAAERIISG